MALWWNWHTRRIQNPLPAGLRVRIPPVLLKEYYPMKSFSNTIKIKRLIVDFTIEAFNSLSRIKELSNNTSYAQTIREALAIYEWYVNIKNNKNKILLEKDGKLYELSDK